MRALGNTCIDRAMCVCRSMIASSSMASSTLRDVKGDALHPRVAVSNVLRYGLPDRLHTGGSPLIAGRS